MALYQAMSESLSLSLSPSSLAMYLLTSDKVLMDLTSRVSALRPV